MDIYAQRISSDGYIEWIVDGEMICTADGDQLYPIGISDGMGGAIIVWEDERNSNRDIYAQRINSSGTPLWSANGTPVCEAENDQRFPKMVSDDSGGVIITWRDERNGVFNYDIYAQRINSDGIVEWGKDGIPICSEVQEQQSATISRDGHSGIFIAWTDFRSNSSYDIYAQHILSDGLAQWSVNGIPICTAVNSQYDPNIISDNDQGAIISWDDERNNNLDIYAQRIDSVGNFLWIINGERVCAAADDQEFPLMVSDGNHGAIIVWWDFRSNNFYDIYAARVDLDGNFPWIINGIPICVANDDQWFPYISESENGSAIICWYDDRNYITSAADVYAQKIDSSGNILWQSNGVVICKAPGSQYLPVLISDTNGGAIISWYDARNGIDNLDIFASKISFDGRIPVELTSFTATAEQNTVSLNWQTATETNNSGFEMQRSQMSNVKSQMDWKVVAFIPGFGTTAEPKSYSFTDENLSSGKYQYRLKQIDFDGTFEYSNQVEVEITSTTEFSLAQNYPNPFNPTTKIKYTIPFVTLSLSKGDILVSLKVFDVLGNEIATLVNEQQQPGTYEVEFNVGQAISLSSGVYYYQLRSGSFVETKKMVVIK